MMKHMIRLVILSLVVCFSSCDLMNNLSSVKNKPSEEADTRVPWKVLWAIAPEIDATIQGTNLVTEMTEEEIELVKEKASWFEEFVEAHTNGKIDIQITIAILGTITKLDWFLSDGVLFVNGFGMSFDDIAKLDSGGKFDSYIYTADYTGIPVAGWRAITWGFSTLVPFYHGQYAPATEEVKQFHTNLYVHEWCHQLEGYFPSLGPAFTMPILHCDTAEYAYTDENTGLYGEERLSKWYADYMAGTIVHYPGATNTCKGVNPEWWQYHPLYRLSEVSTSIKNGATNVSPSSVLTVQWASPVKQNWNDPNFFLVLLDENDIELGFYWITEYMSGDKKTLTVDFSKPLHRVWVGDFETIPFAANTVYRLGSYFLIGWENNDDPATKYKDANFNILFRTSP